MPPQSKKRTLKATQKSAEGVSDEFLLENGNNVTDDDDFPPDCTTEDNDLDLDDDDSSDSSEEGGTCDTSLKSFLLLKTKLTSIPDKGNLAGETDAEASVRPARITKPLTSGSKRPRTAKKNANISTVAADAKRIKNNSDGRTLSEDDLRAALEKEGVHTIAAINTHLSKVKYNANISTVAADAKRIKNNSDGRTLSEDDLRAALEKEGVHGDAAINAYLSQVKNDANISNVRAAATKIQNNSGGRTLSEVELRDALDKEGVHRDAAINAYLSQVNTAEAQKLGRKANNGDEGAMNEIKKLPEEMQKVAKTAFDTAKAKRLGIKAFNGDKGAIKEIEELPEEMQKVAKAAFDRIASRLLTRRAEFLRNSTSEKYVENRSLEDYKKIEESNLAILEKAVNDIKKVSGTEEFVAVYIGNCKSTRIVLEGFEVRLTNASANNEPTNTRPCLAAAALLRQERAESRAGAGASEASEKTTWCRSNGCRCCGLLLPLLLLPLLLLPLPSKR